MLSSKVLLFGDVSTSVIAIIPKLGSQDAQETLRGHIFNGSPNIQMNPFKDALSDHRCLMRQKKKSYKDKFYDST
jgi:hypothetical protein